MYKSSSWKHFTCLAVTALALSGCDAFSSEPTYGGLSAEGFNYTPYNLSEFVIRDKYGNSASGGGDLPPSAGEGRLSCCYTLKGTEFTVDWDVYDADEAIKALDAHKQIETMRKSATVHLSPAEISKVPGQAIIGIHFYPDDHVEVELRSDMSGTRIDYTEVHHWFQTKYGQAANPDDLNWAAAYRRTARVAAQGWTKHRFTDADDLEQYVYFTLLVNSSFEENPAVQRILDDSRDKPGAFGAAMRALPEPVVRQIKSQRFESALVEKKND